MPGRGRSHDTQLRSYGEYGMKGFVHDIENLAVKNNEFRRVLYGFET
jgi:hypothetical protein